MSCDCNHSKEDHDWHKQYQEGKDGKIKINKDKNSKTFHVTVGPKAPNHMFFGQGSNLGFMINGESGKHLYLKYGKTYTFNINTPGHPFYLTTSNTGGTGFPLGNLTNFMPIMKGTMHVYIDNRFPSTFYYQCMLHPKMGSLVNIEAK